MKRFVWFVFGFITCLFLEVGIAGYSVYSHPYGKITYHGAGEATVTDGIKTYSINGFGQELPYGEYKIKLRNGRSLSILKNNNGNVEIEDDGDMVLVNGDMNTSWTTLEKKP